MRGEAIIIIIFILYVRKKIIIHVVKKYIYLKISHDYRTVYFVARLNGMLYISEKQKQENQINVSIKILF